MADQIKTVTDKQQFPMLFKNFFKGRDVYLKTNSGGILVYFLGFHEDSVAFRIPNVKNLPENILIFTRHSETTIYVSLKKVSSDADTFTLEPVKFQIISAYRKEDRNLVQVGDEGKSIVFIASLISDSDIKSSLDIHSKKVDKIKEIVLFDLEKQYDKVKIVFVNEMKNDSRFEYFKDGNTSISIYDLNSDPDEKNSKSYNHYINEITFN